MTRIKTKKANLCKGRNINKVIVRNKLTADGKKFLISDNNKKNRIIVFASPTGLKMLSESKKIHMDGTFHTKARYFGQLCVIHASFSEKKYENNDEVWVKRTIPVAWAFMKRRRTKDYVYVFESLTTVAAVHGYKIDPTDFMIDFESAAKKAIEIIFSKYMVKGCSFHYIVKAYIVSF